MGVERRIFKRVPVKIIAQCTTGKSETNTSEHFLSFTKNLSLQGALLISSKGIKTGEHIMVNLQIPTYFIPLLAYSEVIWSKDAGRVMGKIQAIAEAGIKFLRMDSPDTEKLKNFINPKEI